MGSRLERPTGGRWGRLEPLIERFEAAWAAGGRPDLDAHLPADPDDRRAVLPELAHADLEFRILGGERVRAEEYFARYPELAEPPAAAELAEREYLVRLRTGERPDPAEFLARFPHL